ncbi:putative vacuolar membrane transporter for cationic amino acids [Coemansia sp. BCRC 34301]|nr:putative vacuolar membrane transporter for cationic amino acids [Coemansia sp. BCRC 34301]
MWSLGDIFNLAGALMGGLIFTAVLLPVYYIATDCIVLSQFYIYRNCHESSSDESSALLPHATEWLEHVHLRHAAAQFCGYMSAAVYLGAYIPQLVQNYRSKSTEGLSMLMFILVILANTTYCLSVLTFQEPTYEYLRKYASWLLGASGTIWLELAVLFQFYRYRHNQHAYRPSNSAM